jgi:transcriptional repressor NrdR
MKCPYCGHGEDKVVDSRSSKEGLAVRRRRECLKCEKRFTTYEYIENVPLTIIKNDQRREPYDRQKLMQGIVAACKKRPISMKKIESIVDKIENEVSRLSKTEVPSLEIGELVIRELAGLDDVAYVRFASVYRKFKDRDEFITEVKDMAALEGKK